MYAAAARAVLFTAHCCNCKRAQRDAVGARCGARADGHACFRARLAKQIECENGGGFSRPRAFDGCPSGAEAPGGGLHSAGTRAGVR